jgi:hypothetical protein
MVLARAPWEDEYSAGFFSSSVLAGDGFNATLLRSLCAPLIPFAVLFAAEATIAISDGFAVKHRALAQATAVILAVAALAPSLLGSIRHDLLLTRTDTRTLAKEWIEANIPAGARIAADWPIHTPSLAAVNQPVPDGLVTYDVQYIGGSGLSDHDLNWYRQQGYDYLIASSFIYDISLVFPKQDAERRAFYAALPQQLVLIKAFSADTDGSEPPFLFDEIYGPAISLWQRERPGPTIEVYQIAQK